MPTLNPGSISTATMRAQDLIPRFIDAIPDPARQAAMWARHEVLAYDSDDDSDRDEVGWLLDQLFDVLNEYVPEGHYFGAHPGDGADYGVWEVEPEDGESSDLDAYHNEVPE